MEDLLHVGNFKGKNVYYLNQKGREMIGSENEVKWTLQLEHYLMRNDMYIHYKCPKDWAIEKKVTFRVLGNQERYVVPDARFQKEGKWHFIEVDRIQTMSVNKKKINLYAELAPIMETDFGHKPVIVFYTLKNSREAKLKDWCKQMKVDCVVYTQDDLR